MTNTLYLIAAVLVGVCAATQAAMLASIGRDKTPYEATWINMVAAVCGIAVILVMRGVAGRTPLLPEPFSHFATFLAVGLVAAAALAISVRGLDPIYAITGFFALTYLLGIGYAAPKIGIALFLVGVTAGQLGTALAYDHVGAFGSAIREASPARVLGIAAVMAGALVVRFAP
jgi:transporter family-2 protein